MSKTHRTQHRAEDCSSKRGSILITEEGKGHLTVHGRGEYPHSCFGSYINGCDSPACSFKSYCDSNLKTSRTEKYMKLTAYYRGCLRSAQVHTIIIRFSPLFQIYSGGELRNFIDGYNVHKSNWMRYVNPARSMAEQNLVACQNNGEIYFYTIRPVEPNQELLVWYSQEFAQRLCSQQSDTKPSECI